MSRQINLPYSQTGNYNLEEYSEGVTQSFKSQALIYACIVGMGVSGFISGNRANNTMPISNSRGAGADTYKLTSQSNSGGLNMQDKVSKDAFKEYKEHINTRFDTVDRKLDGVAISLSNISDNMVSKEELLSEIKRQSWKKFIALCTAILAIWKVVEIVIILLPEK